MPKLEGVNITLRLANPKAKKALITIKKDESEFVLGPVVIDTAYLDSMVQEQIGLYDAKDAEHAATKKAEEKAEDKKRKEKAGKAKAKADRGPKKEKEIKVAGRKKFKTMSPGPVSVGKLNIKPGTAAKPAKKGKGAAKACEPAKQGGKGAEQAKKAPEAVKPIAAVKPESKFEESLLTF
jgi:hypothetical protein